MALSTEPGGPTNHDADDTRLTEQQYGRLEMDLWELEEGLVKMKELSRFWKELAGYSKYPDPDSNEAQRLELAKRNAGQELNTFAATCNSFLTRLNESYACISSEKAEVDQLIFVGKEWYRSANILSNSMYFLLCLIYFCTNSFRLSERICTVPRQIRTFG